MFPADNKPGTNTDILANQADYDEVKATKASETAICSNTCYQGGQSAYPCTGPSCPPCWYKNAGVVSCYTYTASGQCPFAGAFDCSKGSIAKRDAIAGHARKHRRNIKN